MKMGIVIENNNVHSKKEIQSMRKSVIIYIVCLIVMEFSACSLLKPMKPATVDSPDGKITVEVIIQEGIPYYQVFYEQELIIDLSKLGFEFINADPMNNNFKVTKKMLSVVDEKWKPVYGTANLIRNNFNELTVSLKKSHP